MTITIPDYPKEVLKYVPNVIGVCVRDGLAYCEVTGTQSYPPGQHPTHCCPIQPWLIAVLIKTARGSRWHGTQTAFINSELRFVVGVNPRDEVLAKWEDYKGDEA